MSWKWDDLFQENNCITSDGISSWDICDFSSENGIFQLTSCLFFAREREPTCLTWTWPGTQKSYIFPCQSLLVGELRDPKFMKVGGSHQLGVFCDFAGCLTSLRTNLCVWFLGFLRIRHFQALSAILREQIRHFQAKSGTFRHFQGHDFAWSAMISHDSAWSVWGSRTKKRKHRRQDNRKKPGPDSPQNFMGMLCFCEPIRKLATLGQGGVNHEVHIVNWNTRILSWKIFQEMPKSQCALHGLAPVFTVYAPFSGPSWHLSRQPPSLPASQFTVCTSWSTRLRLGFWFWQFRGLVCLGGCQMILDGLGTSLSWALRSYVRLRGRDHQWILSGCGSHHLPQGTNLDRVSFDIGQRMSTHLLARKLSTPPPKDTSKGPNCL